MKAGASLPPRGLAPLTGLLLFLQSILLLTGGLVRLTGSGLGCPTWPECTAGSYTPVEGQAEGAFHAWIEFGNRLLTFALFFAAVATVISVFRSYRSDLRFLALTQILGIFAQAILGGITVLTKLHPISVASHFILSIFLIAAATSLHSRRHHPEVRTSSSRVFITRLSLAHILLAFFVIVAGTFLTGAGPHAGDIAAPRLDIDIRLLAWIHGLLVVALLLMTALFYFASQNRYETKKWIVIFSILALAQGAIGYIQFFQGVPQRLVAAHLLGSALVWIAAWRIRLSVVRKPA